MTTDIVMVTANLRTGTLHAMHDVIVYETACRRPMRWLSVSVSMLRTEWEDSGWMCSACFDGIDRSYPELPDIHSDPGPGPGPAIDYSFDNVTGFSYRITPEMVAYRRSVKSHMNRIREEWSFIVRIGRARHERRLHFPECSVLDRVHAGHHWLGTDEKPRGYPECRKCFGWTG